MSNIDNKQFCFKTEQEVINFGKSEKVHLRKKVFKEKLYS